MQHCSRCSSSSSSSSSLCVSVVMTTAVLWSLVLLVVLPAQSFSAVEAFTIGNGGVGGASVPIAPRTRHWSWASTAFLDAQRQGLLRMSASSNDGDTNETKDDASPSPSPSPSGGKAKSFDESTKSIEDEEMLLQLERSSGLDAEEEAAFQARSSEFQYMKDKIRSRAASLGVEKSVATADAIKAAERRARLMQSSDNALSSGTTLDMSVFSDPTKNSMLYNPEDELSDEEMAMIDPTGRKPFLEQALDEFRATAFPGPLDVAKTVGFMAITFIVSASFILKADEVLRGLYTDWGFIPGPDTKLDYSDLDLPPGWEDDLDNLTGTLAQIVETAKQSQPK